MNGHQSPRAGAPGATEEGCALPTPWREPEPSDALRRIFVNDDKTGDGKGRGSRRVSVRGEIVAGSDEPRRLVFESHLEARNLLCLLVRPDVTKVEDQRPRVSYIDAWDVERTHTFDLRVTMADGARVAVAVKPSEIAARTGLDDDLRLIAAQMSYRDADRVVMLTEEDAPRVAVANAKLVLAMRTVPDSAHDGIIADLLGASHDPTTVDALVRASGLSPADAFAAVVRLFGNGALRVLGDGLLGHGARIVRSIPDLGGVR